MTIPEGELSKKNSAGFASREARRVYTAPPPHTHTGCEIR